MSDDKKPDPDKTVKLDPAAMRRAQSRDGEVPVLTEIVADQRLPRPVVDKAALEALARELERAVLERLGPEVDRVIQEKLAKTLNQVLGQALEGVRAELTNGVTQMVREAVAASVSRALALPDAD